MQVDALDEQSGDGVDDEIDNVDEGIHSLTHSPTHSPIFILSFQLHIFTYS